MRRLSQLLVGRLLLQCAQLLVEERFDDLIHELVAMLVGRLSRRQILHEQLVRLELVGVEVHAGRGDGARHCERGWTLGVEGQLQAMRAARRVVRRLAVLTMLPTRLARVPFARLRRVASARRLLLDGGALALRRPALARVVLHEHHMLPVLCQH